MALCAHSSNGAALPCAAQGVLWVVMAAVTTVEECVRDNLEWYCRYSCTVVVSEL